MAIVFHFISWCTLLTITVDIFPSANLYHNSLFNYCSNDLFYTSAALSMHNSKICTSIRYFQFAFEILIPTCWLDGWIYYRNLLVLSAIRCFVGNFPFYFFLGTSLFCFFMIFQVSSGGMHLETTSEYISNRKHRSKIYSKASKQKIIEMKKSWNVANILEITSKPKRVKFAK